MSTIALSRRRRCSGGSPSPPSRGPPWWRLGIVSVQGEWPRSGRGRASPRSSTSSAGLLSIVLLLAVRHSPVRIALVLSALLTVSAAATPAAGTASLWVAQRRRLPVRDRGGAGRRGRTRDPGRLAARPDRSLVLWTVVIAASYAALVGWGALDQARSARWWTRCGTGPGGPRRSRRSRVAEARAARAHQDRPGDARRAGPPAVPAGRVRRRAGVPAGRAARASWPGPPG